MIGATRSCGLRISRRAHEQKEAAGNGGAHALKSSPVAEEEAVCMQHNPQHRLRALAFSQRAELCPPFPISRPGAARNGSFHVFEKTLAKVGETSKVEVVVGGQKVANGVGPHRYSLSAQWQGRQKTKMCAVATQIKEETLLGI